MSKDEFDFNRLRNHALNADGNVPEPAATDLALAEAVRIIVEKINELGPDLLKAVHAAEVAGLTVDVYCGDGALPIHFTKQWAKFEAQLGPWRLLRPQIERKVVTYL